VSSREGITTLDDIKLYPTLLKRNEYDKVIELYQASLELISTNKKTNLEKQTK
jgi:hypothetical protein